MKKWVVKGSGDSDVIASLLRNRGIEENSREEFLNPPSIVEYIRKLPSDFKESLKLARKEILETIKQNRPIIIHGDYDADGICATAILYKTFTQVLGYKNVRYFIPNRFDHGYGLSIESVEEMKKLVETEGLVITVDCGITAEPKVVELAHKRGFKLIVTDHHQKSAVLPKADVLLWNDSVVGSGVALVLSIILGLKDERLISLTGVATVTDLATLKGFNRALVKKSLETLNSNPPLGIKTLLDVSGRRSGEVSTYDLGYVIGPRLNASGRLDSAYDSLKLLLEDDETEVLKVAQNLNAVNLERQTMTQRIYDLADDLYRQKTTDDKVIIVASDEFHEGVIGLVAGKLTQKYFKPSIAISIKGDVAKGSARSVSGVDIIEMLRHFEDRFIGLGGHPMAAGFSIQADKLELFMADFSEYAQEEIPLDLLVPVLNVDLEIPLASVNEDLLGQIDRLKPYGIGNPEPLFLSRNVGVTGSDFVGKDGSHLALKLTDGQNTYKAILFDAKNLGITEFEFGTRADVVYSASLKGFNGKVSIDLVIKDLKTV